MNCYFSKNYKDLDSAGNKAKTDIEKILQAQGFKNIGLKQSTSKNKITGFLLTLTSILKASFNLHSGDILLIQYPLKKYYSFMCKMARWKRAKTITLIHDLRSFRRKKLSIQQEIKQLNQSHYIIAHNNSMREWLLEQGCQSPIGCLEIFDYLSAQPSAIKTLQKSFSIVYAGGLNPRKNSFLYEMGEYIRNYTVNLYGQGFEKEQAKGNEHFICKGFIPSDELIRKVEGDFGLVWDGDSITECAGNWGKYLKYNNPHKTSLYIRCELPVIIWEEAALAPFIKENRIGICIKNLKELDTILSSLSEKEVGTMKTNISIISQRLANGYYTQKALSHAIKELKA